MVCPICLPFACQRPNLAARRRPDEQHYRRPWLYPWLEDQGRHCWDTCRLGRLATCVGYALILSLLSSAHTRHLRTHTETHPHTLKQSARPEPNEAPRARHAPALAGGGGGQRGPRRHRRRRPAGPLDLPAAPGRGQRRGRDPAPRGLQAAGQGGNLEGMGGGSDGTCL